MPPFPSSLPFWSLLQYAVRGHSKVSITSRTIRHAVKNNGTIKSINVIERIAQRVLENIQVDGVLSTCFTPGALLIPVPRSAPLVPGGLWPTEVICQSLVRIGVASAVFPCLRRAMAVNKSAFAAPGMRPGPKEHYDSICCNQLILPGASPRLILVDDIVTRGATLLGASTRLGECYPDVQVVCFAALRVISEGNINAILDPVEGTIQVLEGRLRRDP